MRLDGRVALVTGASRGIGAAVSRAYASEGARVAVNHLPTPRMQALAQEVVDRIRAAGGRALAVPADVSQRQQVQAMVEAVSAELGPVDILVNNAAAYPRTAWTDITEDEWDHVLAVNLKGALLCSQAVYPPMKAAGYGKIITVSSVTVELGMTPILHYVTSKAGLIGFTRSLAREVGKDGIRVNSVMPGAIQTEQELEDFPDQEELAAFLAERQCLPRRGRAADMVGAFVYLASPDSDFVTGQVVTVDGGWIHY